MRALIVFGTLLTLCSCSKAVDVPTVEQFEANETMLTDWMQKCSKGEYSNLGAEEQSRMCGSAESASTMLAQKERAKDTADLIKANSRRQ